MRRFDAHQAPAAKTRSVSFITIGRPVSQGRYFPIAAPGLILVLTSVLLLHLSGRSHAQTQITGAGRSLDLKLDLKALAEPLQDLKLEDREAVDEAIKLIRKKENAQAFLSLTRLTANNPKNSALHVLRAYVLLQLGNLLGALNDAHTAEDSGLRSAYRCWFLARVAYLAGNEPLCRRESEHLAGHPSYGPEAEKLRRDLEARKK